MLNVYMFIFLAILSNFTKLQSYDISHPYSLNDDTFIRSHSSRYILVYIVVVMALMVTTNKFPLPTLHLKNGKR